MQQEKERQKEMFGVADSKKIENLDEIVNSIKQAQEILPQYRKKARFLSLNQLKKEIADMTAAKQWEELNTGLD